MGSLVGSVQRRLDQGEHFARFSVPAEPLFGEKEVAVDLDFEYPTGRLQELDVAVGISLHYFRRQTGGARLVVSDHAVFYGDFHPTLTRNG